MFKQKNKVGKFIQNLREEKKLTQYELADLIPIGREAVSKWERGKTKPSKSSIIRLSKIFDVSIEEILSGEKAKQNKNLLFDLYDEKNKLQRIIKILVRTLIIIILLISIFIIINTYNSIKVYTISCDENNVFITNGIFVTTKEKLYFNLGDIHNKENINNLKLYYNDNNLIYESDNDNIVLFDYYGYDEFFGSNNINTIINNLYLEVSFKGSNDVKKVKLNVKKDFSNNYRYFFNTKRQKGIKEKNSNNNVLNISGIKEKIKENNIYQDYIMTFFEEANTINVLYTNKELKVEWNYNITNNFLEVNEYENNVLINSFYKNNYELNCNIDNCNKKEHLIDEFYNLMKKNSN